MTAERAFAACGVGSHYEDPAGRPTSVLANGVPAGIAFLRAVLGRSALMPPSRPATNQQALPTWPRTSG